MPCHSAVRGFGGKSCVGLLVTALGFCRRSCGQSGWNRRALVLAGSALPVAYSRSSGLPHDTVCPSRRTGDLPESANSTMHVGVVGAGVSGLVLADQLRKALGEGVRVTVLEWGRGPGGRTARRRMKVETGEEVAFDHAAPFFSASTSAFRSGLLKEWEARGLAQRWLPRRGAAEADEELWVGTPSNHAICKALESDLADARNSILFGRHAQKAEFVGGRWQVTATNRLEKDAVELYSFDALVLSDKLLAQPGQQYNILAPEDISSVKPSLPPVLRSSGQVVLLLAFSSPLPVDLDMVRPSAGPLALLVRDSSKPQRSATLETWTVRSTPEYADMHLIGERLDDEAAVVEELRGAFFQALELPSPVESSVTAAFPWDHAQPLEGDRLPEPFSLDAGRAIGFCGDFYGAKEASGVEAAALSGLALGNELAKMVGKKAEQIPSGL